MLSSVAGLCERLEAKFPGNTFSITPAEFDDEGVQTTGEKFLVNGDETSLEWQPKEVDPALLAVGKKKMPATFEGFVNYVVEAKLNG